MRRRGRLERGPLPVHLAVFESAEWGGRDAAEQYSAWMQARSAWMDAHHLDQLPDDAEAWENFPDGEFRADDI